MSGKDGHGSDVKTNSSRKRKAEACQTVLYIGDMLIAARQETSNFLAEPLRRGDGGIDEAFQKISPASMQECVTKLARTLYPALNAKAQRWTEVCHRFSNLLLLSIEVPEILDVLRENWPISSKTLFFSANWFLSSTNNCRKFPFKIFEDLLLMAEVPKSARPDDPTRVPYKMTREARKSTILFVLRTSFVLCRAVQKTEVSASSKSAFILDTEDLKQPSSEASWTAEGMKSSIKGYCGIVEGFHAAVERWCLTMLRLKVKAEVQANAVPGTRAVNPSAPVTVHEFFQLPQAPEAITTLLKEIGDALKQYLTEYRGDNDDLHKNIFVYNDLFSIMEEVLNIFGQTFVAPQSVVSSSPWNVTSLASTAALSVLQPKDATLSGSDRGNNVTELNESPLERVSCFASPLYGSHDTKSASQGSRRPEFALAFASAISVLDLQRRNMRGASSQQGELWKTTGQELSFYANLRDCELRDAGEYRVMWEVMLLKEYFSASFSNPSRSFGALFMRVDPLKYEALTLFDHSRRPDILHAGRQVAASDLVPVSFIFSAPCRCREGIRPLRRFDGIQVRLRHANSRVRRNSAFIPAVERREILFGGTIVVSSDVAYQRTLRSSDATPLTTPTKRFASMFVDAAADWTVAARQTLYSEGKPCCAHPGLILESVGAITADDMKELVYFCPVSLALSDGVTFVSSNARRQNRPGTVSAPSTYATCNISSVCSGVTMERCLSSLQGPQRSPFLSRFFLGPAPEEVVVANSFTEAGSAEAIHVLACQFLLHFRQINVAQWSVMYNTFRRLGMRYTQKFVPKIMLHGPPGTGKTKTIAKLLSLLYHETPEYTDARHAQRQRVPSFRTLICAASNAGVDELLSNFFSEGVYRLNFDSVVGHINECRNAAYFIQVMRDVTEKALSLSSLFFSRAIRPPSHASESIDEQYSDLRLVRIGETEHIDAKQFLLHKWLGSRENDANDDDTEIGFAHESQQRSVQHHDVIMSSHAIKNFDVVFSTCAAAGSRQMENAGNFDLIILDEAGQATEPETLIPLSKYVGQTTVVLFVGDTRQLGPTVISQDQTVRKILGTSFMERSSELQNTDIKSILLQTQYRMHRDISRFVSENFYGGSLSCERNEGADQDYCKEGVVLLGLQRSALCVDTSRCCDGRDLMLLRDKDAFKESSESSSFRNDGEAMLVARIIARLISETPNLRLVDIAVITPYSEQKNNIVQELQRFHGGVYGRVRVDTVDAFQGKECRVVIISLVRSCGRGIGFIGDQRRANVAISRAKDLAIVVGNCTTMRQNAPNPWFSWFTYCNGLSPPGTISSTAELHDLWEVAGRRAPLPWRH